MGRRARSRRLVRMVMFTFALVGFVSLPAVDATHVPPAEIEWACGFGTHRPENCGIEAIDDPTFDGPVWIDGDDKVMGLEIGGDARAYAVKQLDNHEIVNDNVAGTPIAVTWCPLCGSAVVYERVVEMDGKVQLLEFDVSGFLYKHDLVMYDAQTDTLWTQIAGVPIGHLEDTTVRPDHPEAELTPVPSALTTWDAWRKEHPDTKLMDPERSNYGGAYAGYDESCRFGVSGQSQCNVSGLHPKEQVYGVEHNGSEVAYPLFAVLQEGGVVMDAIGDTPVVVAAREGADVRVYDRTGHGFQKEDGAWVDAEGAEWDLRKGEQVDGPGALEEIDGLVLFWFAWKEHHPDTRLWLPEGGFEGKSGDDTGLLPGPGVAAVLVAVALLAAVAAMARRRD